LTPYFVIDEQQTKFGLVFSSGLNPIKLGVNVLTYLLLAINKFDTGFAPGTNPTKLCFFLSLIFDVKLYTYGVLQNVFTTK